MAESQRGATDSWRYLAWWEPDGSMDLERTLATLPANERDAADLMAGLWPDELFYVPGDQLWYAWDSRHLRPDEDNQARKRINVYSDWLRTVLEHFRQQLAAVSALGGMDEAAIAKQWKAMEKEAKPVGFIRGLRRHQGATQLLGALSTVRSVPPEDMADRWPECVNTGNGVLHVMADGAPVLYQPHSPWWRMSYLVNADWVPGADCPEFQRLLWRSCGGVEQVYWYLVKALGYSLLGGNPHRLIFFLSGPTSNGKSTLLEIVSSVLGQHLAYEAQPALVGKSRNGRHSRHEATMRGRRLITISETNEQLDLDELQVKRLTGEKTLMVEMLWKSMMTRTAVTWVIFIGNNQMPSILHLDAALRTRVIVIPMGPEIPRELRDTTMAARIMERERDGILQLLVWGCRAAMAGDLISPPPMVRAKTDLYAEEQNLAALWLAERTVWNGQSPQQYGADCYRSMEQWIEKNKTKPSRQQFYAQLSEVPGVTRYGDANHAAFGGFEIKQDWS